MQDVHCWTRVSPFTLRGILKDGRFKTRFEGVRSLAALDDLEARAKIEQKFYGYALDLPAEQRPVYGYLSAQPNGTATHGHLILDEYGCAAIRLKDEIKTRTTFCIGDSLKSESAPIAYDDAMLPENLDEILPYVEAQFHGGVSVKDIAEVVFLVERITATLNALIDELAKYGIPGRIEIV